MIGHYFGDAVSMSNSFGAQYASAPTE
jgi:hypothetical protein